MNVKGPVTVPQLQPNQTLYVNNLNTKINKNELKRMLYALFSVHGQILSIVAMKTPTTRGQAFIVFKETSSAIVAMRSLQGYPFFDKSLRIQFAKSKSEAAKEMEIILAGGQIGYKRGERTEGIIEESESEFESENEFEENK